MHTKVAQIVKNRQVWSHWKKCDQIERLLHRLGNYYAVVGILPLTQVEGYDVAGRNN